MRLILQKRKLALMDRLNKSRKKNSGTVRLDRMKHMSQRLLDLSWEAMPTNVREQVRSRLESEVYGFKDHYRFEGK